MEAYSKKLLVAITFMAMSCVTHVMDEPDAPQNVERATPRVDEIQEPLVQATQTLQELTQQIVSPPTDDLVHKPFDDLLDQYVKPVLQAQYQILATSDRHYEQLLQVEQTADLQEIELQRVQAEFDSIQARATAQPNDTALQKAHETVGAELDRIKQLSEQLTSQKEHAENTLIKTQKLSQQAIDETIKVVTKLQKVSAKVARQQGISKQEQQAQGIATQIIASLAETEASIKTLFNEGLYKDTLRGATVAQTIQNRVLPITAEDIPTMQARAEQAKVAAEEIEGLIPVGEPADDEPVQDGQPAPTQQPKGPTQQDQSKKPGAPSTPAQKKQPSVGPPGKASSAISAANSKLKSALKRLNVIKGYFNEIDAAERALVKRQAASILKEYESEFKKLTQKIKQVKAGGQLDQAKLWPFNEFLELTDKLSGLVKNL